jgi:hypothetical protein
MRSASGSIGSLAMRRPSELPGREAVIRQVKDLLKGGRSVLLFGPEAIGKSAIVRAVVYEGLVVIDPLEHISPQRAYHIRRALDHGIVHLGASRVSRGRQMGSVGRIMWRFTTVRVRELPDVVIRRIVTDAVRVPDQGRIDSSWIQEIAALARGRPGFATAMGRFAIEWWRQHGYLPMPALAFAASREDTTIRALRDGAANVRR